MPFFDTIVYNEFQADHEFLCNYEMSPLFYKHTHQKLRGCVIIEARDAPKRITAYSPSFIACTLVLSSLLVLLLQSIPSSHHQILHCNHHHFTFLQGPIPKDHYQSYI